jgi:hypothetical protein
MVLIFASKIKLCDTDGRWCCNHYNIYKNDSVHVLVLHGYRHVIISTSLHGYRHTVVIIIALNVTTERRYISSFIAQELSTSLPFLILKLKKRISSLILPVPIAHCHSMI